MPRANYLQKVLRGSKPPQPVAMSAKKQGSAPVKKAYVPEEASPEKYSKYSQALLTNYENAVSENKPHFQIGGKEVFFPWAGITLLRPSAKMTPYQAQFQVPRNFNKLDLRDYLWNLYGLRALNVTTQIKWSEWTRARMSRYRTPQVKKMIIDMEEPFLWPEEDRSALESHSLSSNLQFRKYEEEMESRSGSDLKKPVKAFDGILGPYPDAPQSYVPKQVEYKLKNTQKKALKQDKQRNERELISEFLKL